MTRNTLFTVIVVLALSHGAIAARRREDVQPTITEHPENVVVPKNAPARLNCRAEGKPEPSISWLKDGYPMDMSTGSSHITLLDTGEMLFLSVSRLDVGTYQCIAENRAGATRSRNATLEVAFLRDDFRTDPSDSVGLAGEPVVLECQPPRGYPEPVVSWSKDGEDVNTDGDRVKVLQDGNLMISEARRTDTGSYVCIATNTIGTRQSPPAILNVHARPTFTRPAEDAIAAPGDTVDLHCVVEGDPIPTVTWSRMDGELPQGRFQISEDNSLRLRHVMQDDEGIYICRAENGWGTETMMVTLDVNTEPTFTTEPLDQTVSIGHVVSFECKVTGSPTPAIFWQKGGEQDLWYRGGSYSNGRIAVSEEGELEIQDVGLEDEGYYTCSALSVSGTADVSAYLTVLATPGQPPPVIRYVPSNQTYLSGAFGLIPCEATGDPDPVLQWSKNSAPIQTNSRIIVRDSGTLEIGNLYVSDAGLYTCTASNEWGQTSWSASLQVVEPTSGSGVSLQSAPSLSELPSPPGPLVPSNITKTTINLSWQQPASDTPVTHYRLEYYSQQTAPGWLLYSDHIEEERVLVQQLRTGTTYLFLVRAVNDRGVGPPSPISQPITTRDSGRNSVVLQLAEAGVAIKDTLVLSNTEVKVIWQVDQHTDLIEGYNLKHWINSNPEEVTVQVVIGATSKKLVGLQPDTHYSVAVQPFIGDVTGPDSSTASFFTEDVVIRPGSSVLQNKLDTCGISIQSVDALDSTTLQVTWQVNRHTAYISGYHIKIQSLEVNWSNTVTIETETARSELLTDLTPWTQYAVTITPYKGQYTGQESRVVVAKTGPDVPYSAPRSVFGESNGSSAILVGWLPPPVHMVPGVLAGYYVYVLGNSSEQHKNAVAGNMSSSVMVTGLNQGKAYRVMVAAFTTAGSGPNSTEITVRVPPVLKTDDLGGNITMIVSQPWFIATLASLMLITIIFITAWLWRRRQKQKQSTNITKASIGKDTGVMQNIGGVGPGSTALNQSNSQAWAETQSWLHTTASDGHDPEMCKQTLATTDCQIECKDGNMSQLAESQRSSNFDASNPTLSTFQGSIPRQRGSPEYAVVESELHTPCCQGSYPRAPHLLCIHDTEPYASATLVLPPNIREYAARRQKCSDSSSNSGSGYNTQPTGVRKTSRSGLENVAYSSSGSGPPAVPKRDGSMPSASDCPSLPSDSGASSAGDRGSRKKQRHRGGSKQQPARNWTELLPPPPEQPPTDIDSPTGTTPCLAPCSHAPSNAHMSQAPPCSYAANSHMNQGKIPPENDRNRKKAPTPPIRQFHPISPVNITADTQHTMPGVMLPAISHRPQPTNSLPNKQGNNRSGSPADRMQQSRHDVPDRHTEANQLHQGGSCLATKRLFEDPRHEQLGKELLEFNDDMSQSEILSDNEESGPAVTCNTGLLANHTAHDYLPSGHKPLPDRGEDTDMESGSNCTDAMLGSWSSMNGSSSSGRHSSVSESSDGSFFTDADFASAVAAAAQSSGMNVVGSTVTDPRAGKKQGRSGGQRCQGDHNDHTTQSASAGKKPSSTAQPPPDHHGRMTTFKPVPAPPRDAATTQSNHTRKDHPILHQDTNHSGLTVTANPLAFAMENAEM